MNLFYLAFFYSAVFSVVMYFYRQHRRISLFQLALKFFIPYGLPKDALDSKNEIYKSFTTVLVGTWWIFVLLPFLLGFIINYIADMQYKTITQQYQEQAFVTEASQDLFSIENIDSLDQEFAQIDYFSYDRKAVYTSLMSHLLKSIKDGSLSSQEQTIWQNAYEQRHTVTAEEMRTLLQELNDQSED